MREAVRNPGAFLFKLALSTGSQALVDAAVANPRTFNQKVRYRMVHDRRAILGTFADKLTSKRYVAERLGPEYVPRLLGAGTSACCIDVSTLPREYALKVSHASGGVLLVTDSADRTVIPPNPGGPFIRLRLHPDTVRFTDLAPIMEEWLRRPYAGANGEWAYSLCTPTILAEEYLSTPDGTPPPDLKFFVFGGEVRMVRLDSPHAGSKTLNHYLADGTPLPVRFGEYHTEYFPELRPAPELPPGWQAARTLAAELGHGLDFVRVDTYIVGERVLIGELTNYPTNGTGRYEPRHVDRWLGSFWKLHQVQ